MGQKKKLQIMAFIPKTTTIKLYYVGFPAEWKEKLAKLAKTAKPNYDYAKINLPLCSALRKICTNWVHGLVEITSMKEGSDDSRWITCLPQIDEKTCREICVNLKAAVLSFYSKQLKDDENKQIKEARDEFFAVINEKELLKHVGCDEVEIINENGKITSPYAYNGFCLKIKEKLCENEINYDGLHLKLHPSGQRELMSQILSEPKGDLYAYVFQLSLQTVPPKSKPMLLLQCSRRIFKNNAKRSKKYFKNDMSVYVKHKIDREYYCLHITDNGKKWNETDQRLYKYNYPMDLPDVETLMNGIEKYNKEDAEPRILCTISTVNSFDGGNSESRVKKGVSNKDKQLFYDEVYQQIKDCVDKIDPIEKEGEKNENLNFNKELVDFSKVIAANGYRGVKIEICSYDIHKNYAEEIRNKLREMLSADQKVEGFSTEIVCVPLGKYADLMCKTDYMKVDKRKERINQIAETIEPAKNGVMTGSIVILPCEDNNRDMRDVKDLIRCGFALAGKVTQFFIPPNVDKKEKTAKKDETNAQGLDYKINNTIYDLLRQFGYSCVLKKCLKKLPTYPIIAIGALSHFTTISGEKVKALPISLTYDITGRTIKVECPLIKQGVPISYYEACLELVKLSMARDIDKESNKILGRYTEMKLKGIENYYREKDVIVLVSGEGFVRNELWPGISNKRIESYTFNEYGAEKIDIGNARLSVMFDFKKSKVRIVRIRANDEVPDYFLNDGTTTKPGKGIYKHEGVYYVSIPAGKYEQRYSGKQNEKFSKDAPCKDYYGKRLLEYFPLNMCENDNPMLMIHYLNELRKGSIQYSDSTNYPLPLHNIEALEEYINFD